MANNFGILTNTIVLNDVFSLFLQNLLPIRQLILDVSGEDGGRRIKPGATITIKDWRNTIVAYQVGAGGYNQPTDVTAGQVQVTMPQTPWAVSIALTPTEYRLLASGATGGDDYNAFRTKLQEQMQFSLGKLIIDAWLATITAAAYPNHTVSAAGTFSRSTEVDLDTKFFGRNVTPVGAQGILAPSTYSEWVKDHITIQNYTGENRQKGLLMNGGIDSQNSAFTMWRTNSAMPADAPRGFVCSKPATVAVFRIPDEATYENDPVSLNEVVDEQTNVALLSRLWKNAQTGTIQLDLATIFLFTPGQPEALERITLV